jgi:hypothetical protein
VLRKIRRLKEDPTQADHAPSPSSHSLGFRILAKTHASAAHKSTPEAVVIHFAAVFVSLQALNYGSGQFSLKTVSEVAQELTQSVFSLGGTEKLGITLAESLQ